MAERILTKIDLKYFKESVRVVRNLAPRNTKCKYTYLLSHKETPYILKGFQLFDLANNTLNEDLSRMSEVYESYFFMKALSVYTSHIVRPLAIDWAVDSPGGQMHVEIVYEHGGVPLSELRPLSVEQTYNLMCQAANAFSLLHKAEVVHFDIKPENVLYDQKKDLVRISGTGNAFGCATHCKSKATTINFGGVIKTVTLKYAPPEVLQAASGEGAMPKFKFAFQAVDIYCWAMTFYSLLANKKSSELESECKKYKMGSVEDHKSFVEEVKRSIDLVETSSEKERKMREVMKGILLSMLKFGPKKRATTVNVTKELAGVKEITINYLEAKADSNKRMRRMLKYRKLYKRYLYDEGVMSVELVCGHKVLKDKLIAHALQIFLNRQLYEYNYPCGECRRVKKLKYLSLDCRCVWKKFGDKVKFGNEIANVSFGNCDDGCPLSSIDLCLINDYISPLFTYHMLSDWPRAANYPSLWALFTDAINEEKASYIASLLRNTKALVYLKIKRDTYETANEISEALKYNKSLKKLSFNFFTWQIYDLQKVGEALMTNKTVTDLEVVDQFVTLENKAAVYEALKVNMALKRLSMQGLKTQADEGKALCEALRMNKTLTELQIKNASFLEESAKFLSEALKANRALTHLDISRASLDDHNAKLICEFIKTSKALRLLNLTSNRLNYQSAVAISEGLKTNNALKELYLGYNEIGNDGTLIIGKALEVNKTLTHLCMDSNNIMSSGMEAMGKALCANIRLTHLSLKNNNLKGRSVSALCRGLGKNKVLTHLFLNHCFVCEWKMEAIIKALDSNAALKELDITGNCILKRNYKYYEFCTRYKRRTTLVETIENYKRVHIIY